MSILPHQVRYITKLLKPKTRVSALETHFLSKTGLSLILSVFRTEFGY